MKLRVHGNSLRFRFSVEETRALGRGEPLSETVCIAPEQQLGYRVTPVANLASGARAAFSGGTMQIDVDAQALAQWSAGDDLALSRQLQWDGGQLTILLEKDLQRLNPKPGENAADVLPNPLFGKVRCDHP